MESKKSLKAHDIIYFILKHKQYSIIFLAVLTIAFGTWGFYEKDKHPVTGIISSIKMFGLDLPNLWVEINWQILTAIVFAIITISFFAMMIFIRDSYQKYRVIDIFSRHHNVVFGMGGVSLSFLNSIVDQKNQLGTVIIESDSNNKNIEEYRKKGVGVIIADALKDKTLDKLDLIKMRNAVIALGNDRVNIELAKKLIDLRSAQYEKQKHKKQIDIPLKLIVHIQNRDLDILFHQEFILPDENLKIDLKTFSFFQEVAIDLFENYDLDGKSSKFINSDEDFCSILMGNGILVKDILYQMAQLSHLPNENVHTVYIVDKDSDKLIVELKKYLYYNENNFPNFKLVVEKLDSKSLDFFSHSLWQKENIANVIIAYDNEAENLDLAIELFNRTYIGNLKDINMPSVLFAIFDQKLLAEIINGEKKSFDNFFAFGNSDNVLSFNNLINEEGFKIAKLINSDYGDEYNPEGLAFDINKANKKWYNRNKYHNKISSIAQANHIDIKLKAMGLMKQKANDVNTTKERLLSQNRQVISKLFDEDREALGIGDAELKLYSKELHKFYNCINNHHSFKVMYFPNSYATLFEKMIRMEHNRWNAFHYLAGWEYEEIKVVGKFKNSCEKKEWEDAKKKENKMKKKHDCLLPIQDFKNDNIRITIIYDIYSFLYLPNYLAETGYAIVPWKSKHTAN